MINLSTVRPDFASIVAQLQSSLGTKNSWTDLLATSTGQTLMEFVGAIGAFDQFSLESLLQELYLSTAKLDSSILASSKMLGVRLSRKSPAYATVTLTRTLNTTSSLLIPIFSQFTANGIKLFNRSSIFFDIGQTSVTVTLYEGAIVSNTFNTIGDNYQSVVSFEDSFSVSNTDVLVSLNGVSVPVVQDGLWHYKSAPAVQDITTSKGALHIMFGNTTYGTLPTANSILVLSYAVTQGNAGNLVSFSTTPVTQDSNADVAGVATSPLQNGADPTSTSTYKQISPLLFAAGNRAVSPADYNAQPLLYPGVLDAKIVGQADLSPTDLRYMNLLRATLVTTTVWDATAFNNFVAYMYKLGMYTCRFYRQDPIARSTNISALLGLKSTADVPTVTAAVNAALAAFFAPRRSIIGFDIYVNDIHHLIRQAHVSIDWVELLNPTLDVISEVVAPTVTPSMGGAIAVVTGYIGTVNGTGVANTTLTVSAVNPGTGLLAPGHIIAGAGMTTTTIVNQLTGTTGLAGTYTVALSQLVPSTTVSAGLLAAGTYYYRVTATNVTGETLPGLVYGQLITAGMSVVLTWTNVIGATGYKVYGRTDSTGLASLLIATLGTVNTYTDTGAVTPAGALPSLDTSGVHYPSLGTVSLTTTYSTRQMLG